MLIATTRGVIEMKTTHHLVAQLLLILTGLFTSTSLSEAQAPKPYFLASNTSSTVVIWKIDPGTRTYKQVASWRAPGNLTIQSICAYPKSRKLLVSGIESYNSKVFTLTLSPSSIITAKDHSWIGYGYPLISPSEMTVAIVGWDGLHGYIDLRTNKRDSKLAEFSRKRYDNIGAWNVGKYPHKGLYAVASWFRPQREVESFKIRKYAWKGEKIEEVLRFRTKDNYTVGVVLDRDGSIITAENGSIKRITGRSENIRTRTARSVPGYVGSAPLGNSTGLSLVRNSVGETVLVSSSGDTLVLTSGVSWKTYAGPTPAINTFSDGEVAMAGNDGIHIGRWVGSRFYRTIFIPGKYFTELEYLGLAE